MIAWLKKKLGLRKVYSICFPCDQTIDLWTGNSRYQPGAWVYTFLGKEAWRTTDLAEAKSMAILLKHLEYGEATVSNPTYEYLLDREDWTW